MESVFSYLSSRFVADPTTGLWVVAYTEQVVLICAGLLLDVYDTYRLWWVPRDVIAFARTLGLDMDVALGSCLLYTSPSPRDQRGARMPSSA